MIQKLGEISRQISGFCDADEDSPAAGRAKSQEVKAKVEALQKDKNFASINPRELQEAVMECFSGDFLPLAKLCATPLLRAIAPALAIGLLVVVALFFVKWWVGLIAIVLYIPCAVIKVFLEVKRLAGKLGFSAIHVIKEFISDIF